MGEILVLSRKFLNQIFLVQEGWGTLEISVLANPSTLTREKTLGVEEVGEKTFSMRGVSIKGTGMIEEEVSEVVDSLTFSGGREPLVGGGFPSAER